MSSLDVHMVPARIHFGERSYLDKVSLDSAEFYRMMAAGPVHPTTSQPPPGDFRRLYQILASHHAGVVSIHITAWGSGTCQAAASASAWTKSRWRSTRSSPPPAPGPCSAASTARSGLAARGRSRERARGRGKAAGGVAGTDSRRSVTGVRDTLPELRI